MNVNTTYKCERNPISWAYFFLLIGGLFTFAACSKDDVVEEEDIFLNLEGNVVEIVKKIIPADGTQVLWKYKSVHQGDKSLQWDNFSLNLVKSEKEGKTVIAYTAKLPDNIEGNSLYRNVWPLAGHLAIGTVSGVDGINVVRYVDDQEDTNLSNGKISFNGEDLVISFNITFDPAAGVPVGAWLFTLVKEVN